jgi:hypothetical protein
MRCPVLEPFGDVSAWFRGNDRRPGQPLLIDPDGRTDPRIDAFFASRRMTARADTTNRKYARVIRVWLNFLLARGVRWDQATAADIVAFKFWRRTDDRNPQRVQASTFGGDVAALCALYDWTGHRFGVASPIDKHSVVRDGVVREAADVRPDYVRRADVKWLTRTPTSAGAKVDPPRCWPATVAANCRPDESPTSSARPVPQAGASAG